MIHFMTKCQGPKHPTRAGASTAPGSGRILGKAVHWVDTAPFNAKSGFEHKQLSDGPTFSAGTACAFSCRYCYVESQIFKQTGIRALLAQTQAPFDRLVIRRRQPIQQLARALSRRMRRGETGPSCEELLPADLRDRWRLNGAWSLAGRIPKFYGPEFAHQVVFGSPLVDVAATAELARETVELCEVLLRLTRYDLRLLSKSPLLGSIVAPGLDARLPGLAKARTIFGFSTGTLDDEVAPAIEPVPLPSQRLAALHQLQATGFRTYGMLCPILPQKDPQSFARRAMAAIQAEQCEEIWAEPVNFRGTKAAPEKPRDEHARRQRNSFAATMRGLQRGGHADVAERFQHVAADSAAWETYCRATFEACAAAAPRRSDGTTKLRWMQYPRDYQSIDQYWKGAEAQGALLLGPIVSSYRKAQLRKLAVGKDRKPPTNRRAGKTNRNARGASPSLNRKSR